MRGFEAVRFRRAALAVAAVCFLVFGMNMTHSFVWDDAYNVVKNTDIRDLSNVPSFFTEAWGASAASEHSRELNTNYWRPVALTSYAIDYALVGTSPWWFHFVNVSLHALCSVLVLLLGWRLFPEPGEERLGVCAAALIFAVHPVHTEVINVITYRTDLLAACFTLLGLVVWIAGADSPDAKQRRRAHFLWVPLLYFLGLGSKEMAFMLPLLVFLYEWLVRRRAPWKLAMQIGPLVGVAAAYLALRAALLTPSPMVYFDINWPTHIPVGADGIILTMLSVVTLYARLLVAPWPLNPFYEWSPDVLPVQVDPTEPVVVFGVCIVGLWCVVAFKLARADRKLLFLWLLMPVVLVPVSHVIPIIIAAGERFLYLALAGPVMVASVALFRRYGTHRVLTLTYALFFISFATLSIVRSHQWRSDEAILEAYVSQWPQSYNAWKGLRDYRITQANHAAESGDSNELRRLMGEVEKANVEMRAIAESAWRRESVNFRILELGEVADCIDRTLASQSSPQRCLIRASDSH